MRYAEKLRHLSSVYDRAETMTMDERVVLYREMMEYDELKLFAEEEITNLYEHFKRNKDLNSLKLLGIEQFVPKSKTFYEDGQNVHILSKSTVNVAKQLIAEYGQDPYFRPKEFKEYQQFFDDLEQHSFYAFDPKQLFMAVYMYAINSRHSTELLIRIKEEISSAEGLCITGMVVRLINALRGFDTRFQVKLSRYEDALALTFYALNKVIDPFEDVLHQIEEVINNGTVNIPPKYALKILKAYTGETWTRHENTFTVKMIT